MNDQKQPEDPLTEEFEKAEIFSREEPEQHTLDEEESIDEENEEEGFSLEFIQLQQDLKAEKDRNLRLLAEIENTRKRMQKEKEDMIRFTQEKVIVEFLTALDNFENALGFATHASSEVQNWAKGFEMILSQFKEVLSSHNVHAFHSEKGSFDPHLHEVIEVEETNDVAEATILKEFVKGYKCGDRIIRPARVKIAKKKEQMTEEVTKENENEQ